jgi:hypothetical protein
MAKELSKYRTIAGRKAEYSNAGIAALEELYRENQGEIWLPMNNVVTRGPKRGNGRAKASDAGPSKSARRSRDVTR